MEPTRVLVRAAHWMTHLDHELARPVWSHWIADLSARRTLVRYDERGCGVSDHDAVEFSLDAWVQDLAFVVDAAGLERFTLLGVSQCGAVSIAYAARYPERVERPVLCNAYARRVPLASANHLFLAREPAWVEAVGVITDFSAVETA